MVDYKLQFRELTKGLLHLEKPEELEERLFNSCSSGKPLIVKLGADPTAESLHIGHMIPVHVLKRFQDFGHDTVMIFGDATARIGDPTGNLDKRQVITPEQVNAYMKNYKNQIFKVLDPEKTRIEHNSKWLNGMDHLMFLTNIYSKVSINQLLQRDDFKERYEKNISIVFSELAYPILQAYDSVALVADIEIGGNDQLFNFMFTRDFQRRFFQKPEVIMTFPTILGLDGVEKMSKSKGNTINVSDSAFDMYHKTMSIDDKTMINWYPIISSLGVDCIDDVVYGKVDPMEAKKQLAFDITSSYYGADHARQVEKRFELQYQNRGIPNELPQYHVRPGLLTEMIVETGLFDSKSHVRRLIQQNAIKLGEELVSDIYRTLGPGRYSIRIGKKIGYIELLVEDKNN
ncbi:MAG: tyrosine--tRNA ligase [Candidatus Woesearchaeota archaeon]